MVRLRLGSPESADPSPDLCPARHPSLHPEVRGVNKRVARHRKIDAVRSGRQSCRLEVEDISTRVAQRGVEAKVNIRV